MRNFDELTALAKSRGLKSVAVAAADDAAVLEAIKISHDMGLCTGILVGDSDAIKRAADQIDMDLSVHRVVDVKERAQAARKAVSLVRAGEAEILMKGYIQTGDLMRAVLDRENGLRAGRMLSHVAVMQTPTHHKLYVVSDGGLNIAPDLKAKMDITQNAINVAHKLGIELPKVAIVGALELVNTDMPATLDAALISKAAERGQIKGAIVDGPLAIDGAFSKEALEHKGIKSPVEGDADVVIVPDIETGNVMIKSIQYTAGGFWAGAVVGAGAPIVLVSRADHADSKAAAVALTCLLV